MDIRREVRVLRVITAGNALLLCVLGLAAFRDARQHPRYEEIDVERINVVEPDGTTRLVISNRARSPGPVSRGEPFGYPGGTRPGLIFYNDEGTENGGLTFGGARKADGTYDAYGHFSFDQYDQDQVVYLQYLDHSGNRLMGLTVADRADVPITELVARRDSISRLPDGPEKTEAMRKLMHPPSGAPVFAPRLFAGRDRRKNALVSLSAPDGTPRVRLQVDSLGRASLDFLDAEGAVVFSLPDSAHAGARR